jgi:hypothetical protein
VVRGQRGLKKVYERICEFETAARGVMDAGAAAEATGGTGEDVRGIQQGTAGYRVMKTGAGLRCPAPGGLVVFGTEHDGLLGQPFDHLIIGGHFEEIRRRFGALDIREPVDHLAGTRIAALAVHHRLEILRGPYFVDDLNVAIGADIGRRDRVRDAFTFGHNPFD